MAIKLLVTGVNGQLARALTERAAGRDDLAATCIGRPDLDLDSPETVMPAFRSVAADVVINAAAYTAVDTAEDEPQRAMRINADGAGAVAAAARSAGAQLIHMSTDYVYDGDKPSPYIEVDEVAPRSVYGRSKLAGEWRVRDAHPDATIMRTAWVYSPFGRNFVKTMLALARSRDTVPVVDNQFGCPTSAFDIADALLAMVDRWQSDPRKGHGETYHCAGAGQATWCGLARRVFATSGSHGGPVATVTAIDSAAWPTKATRPQNSRLDCSKLQRDFICSPPDWRRSTDLVVRRLLAGGELAGREGDA